MFEILEKSPLFKNLTNNEIKLIVEKTTHQIRKFSSNELLAITGEPVLNAMILISGRLKGEMLDFNGNTLRIEELDAPQMVAAAFLFGQQAHFPVNLSAITEGSILLFSKENFTIMLSSDKRLLNNYLTIVSNKAQFLSSKISFLSFKTIKEKIAFYILQKTDPKTLSFDLNNNQTQLAELFGVARPSLSRSIGEMENEGIINWSPKRVIVLNINKLNSIIEK